MGIWLQYLFFAGVFYFINYKSSKKDEKIKELNKITTSIVKTIEEGFVILTDKITEVSDKIDSTEEKSDYINKKTNCLTELVNDSLQQLKSRMISLEYRVNKLETVGIL